MRYWVLFAVCAALYTSCVQAQIYTWTDSNGRVHYSDQPADKNAVLQSIDVGTMLSPKLITVARPTLFKAPLYPLIVAPLDYSDSLFDAPEAVARFYFGDDCSSPVSLSLTQLRSQLPSVTRTPEQFQVDMFRAIRRLGHDSLYRAGHYSGPPLESTEVRYLSGEIIALDIAACRANGAVQKKRSDLSETAMAQFKIAQVWLQVRWKVTDQVAGQPLLSFVTEGSAATQVNADVQVLSAVREGFLAASANALDNQDLRQVLTRAAPSGLSENFNAP